jgi:hypothetical protein
MWKRAFIQGQGTRIKAVGRPMGDSGRLTDVPRGAVKGGGKCGGMKEGG